MNSASHFDPVLGKFIFDSSNKFYTFQSNTQSFYQIESNYLLINTTGRPSHFLMDFGKGSYPTLMSNKYTYPTNLYFGMSYGTSRPQNVWKKWVGVGAVFSIVLLILHILYIGNDVMYKVDNTLILAQTVFLG